MYYNVPVDMIITLWYWGEPKKYAASFLNKKLHKNIKMSKEGNGTFRTHENGILQFVTSHMLKIMLVSKFILLFIITF